MPTLETIKKRTSQRKANKIASKSATPALLEKVDVISNKNKNLTVSLIGGTVRVLYYESLLQDTVRASVVFTDAGNTLSTSKINRRGRRVSRSKKVGAVEGLPIVGEEKVNLKFTDNNKNTIDFNSQSDNSLYINTSKPEKDIVKIIHFISDQGYTIKNVNFFRSSLEDIFMKLTKKLDIKE